MARRPAYHTKSEIARRAARRSTLFAELTEAGDDAEDLVPLISAWIQLRRRRHEYRVLFDKPYSSFPSGLPESENMREARMQVEMAFAFSYVARRAVEAVLRFQNYADSASATALTRLTAIEPYSQEQLELISSLYADTQS